MSQNSFLLPTQISQYPLKLFFYESGSFILGVLETKQQKIVRTIFGHNRRFAGGSQNLTNTIILQRPCVWAYRIYFFTRRKSFKESIPLLTFLHFPHVQKLTGYRIQKQPETFFPFQVQNYTCLKFYRRSACYTLTDIRTAVLQREHAM